MGVKQMVYRPQQEQKKKGTRAVGDSSGWI
jgi:hypothetical protein